MPSLFDAFKQYINDAKPGGLLNPEVPPGGPTELAKGLLSFTPGIGDAISGYDAYQSAKQGNYGEAALNGLGLLPFVPAMGGITKQAGDWLHGSDNLFDKFEIQKNRLPALFFSPVYHPNMKTQAESYGKNLYRVSIDDGKRFRPTKNQEDAELYKTFYPNTKDVNDVGGLINYSDVYIDSPIIKELSKRGYNRFAVHEPMGAISEAVLDPSIINILERESIK